MSETIPPGAYLSVTGGPISLYLDAVDVLLGILEVTHYVVQLTFSVSELFTLLHKLLKVGSINTC